ncbi:hypothetical protein ACTAZP_11740 [Flavonifractor plautii]|uniref:hypothetical protein n=1 Tax=Flavonifractor plautii TaxID=292800 RepID=UPI003EEEE558
MANSDTTKLLGDHSTLCLAERAGYGGTWDPRMELTTSGATYVQGDFTIHAVDARHIAFKHFPDGSYMTGEPLCYIIRVKDGPTCFFGGDTSLTYDMKLWGELFRPDVAFLGIGGVDLQGRSLDEMDPPPPRSARRCWASKPSSPCTTAPRSIWSSSSSTWRCAVPNVAAWP